MQIELTAKPLQFNTDGPTVNGYCEYTDSLMGFHIAYDPEEQPDYQFAAEWGEGETQHFRTLEEAQAWCQAEADGWIKDCGQATVIAA